MSLADACRDRGISGPAVRQWLHRNPDKGAEISALIPRKPGLEKVGQNFGAILKLIAGGDNAETACRTLGVNWRQLHDWMRDNPDERARFVAATDKRERGPNAKGTRASAKPRRQWTAADFDAALDFIERYRRPALEKAMPDSVPSLASCYRRAAVEKDFARRFSDAMQRHVIATAPMRFVGGEEISLLHAALMRVPAYCEGWRRFKGFDDRDDLISEFVVAVLEGAIALADVDRQAARRDIVRRVAGSDRAMTSLSVAQVWADDERVTLGDTISNDDGILFY